MSDGNFNRALLPAHSFRSGVTAGEARMRQRALEAFREWVSAHTALLAEEQADALQDFAALLRSKA